MSKFILILCFLSLPSFAASDKTTPPTATPAVISENVKVNTFNARESHWIVNFGFESMNYQTTYNFDGARKDFKPGDQAIYGGRLGLGGELYLGKGFVTTSKVEGYYSGTLFTKALSAGSELPIDYSSTKRTSQIFGLDLNQSLGYLFEEKVKNPFMEQVSIVYIEPFVEAGLGYGRAFNKIDYVYDTSVGGGGLGTTGAPVESYRHKVEDKFVSQRLAAGLNVTSATGYFLQLKVTSTILNITDRTESRRVKENTQAMGNTVVTNSKDPKIDPIMIYTIGGGYKF